MRDEVSARAGEDVHLPCSVNREECGDYHSIKWYSEASNIDMPIDFVDEF